MTIERALTGLTKAGASAAVYSEDVFSCYLYTGTGASQTITNGIDLSTKGGLIWAKVRNTAGYNHHFLDTVRGRTSILNSDTTNAAYGFTSSSTQDLTSFNTNGFSVGTGYFSNLNDVSTNIASWTFRKQPKFFDVVTYTGTGANTTISHNLGATPGMIIVKRTDTTGNWKVYHNGLTSAAYYCNLNATTAQTSDTTVWNSTAPTSSVFSVGTHADVNASGGTYVAYIYAASNSGGFGPAGTDSVVACGSFTGDSTITLGWEPQYFLFKRTDSTSNWRVLDNMRGLPVIADSTGSQQVLLANTSGAESIDGITAPTATGFKTFLGAGTYIYLAIRRPMKTPTDATKVFAPITSSSAAGTTQTTSFPIDSQWKGKRATDTLNMTVDDRLRGVSTTSTASGVYLTTSSTNVEATTSATTQAFSNTGFQIPTYYGGASSIYWNFRRAPGFFDVVCYTGTGTLQDVSHNLGVAPELIIVKSRIGALGWITYAAPLGITKYLTLQTTDAAAAVSFWGSSSPTASTFPVDAYTAVNSSSSSYNKYVAYLFASCPGVSKVFSYTGNGSSQTINCGFTAGARFVLIKRTDSTGSWWVFDSARGIVSAADPALQLNSTAAEVTSADAIDPDSSGFIVNQETTCNLNVSSGTYVFLAIA